MTQRLDPSFAGTIADEIIATLEFDGGYSIEEMIPGLVQAIILLARTDKQEDQLLDEASNLLADGGVIEDPDTGRDTDLDELDDEELDDPLPTPSINP